MPPPEGMSSKLEGDILEVSMGPQHPSTHGVFRMNVAVDGEIVVKLKPVFGYLHRRQRQDFGGQIFYPNPRQQEKPRVVQHPSQMGLARLPVPADPAVARGHLPGRRPETQRPQQPLVRLDQVAYLRARQGRVTEVMVTFDQPVPEPRGRLVGHRQQP